MAEASAGGSGRIVVGVDGSPSSIAALRWAAAQADRTGAVVDLVTTWEWPTSFGWSIPFPTGFDPEESARKVVDDALAAVSPDFPEVAFTSHIEHGHPAPVLVETSGDAALLVVGSRGHGEFAGMLIGSVSEYCAAHGHCPVVVYRSTE